MRTQHGRHPYRRRNRTCADCGTDERCHKAKRPDGGTDYLCTNCRARRLRQENMQRVHNTP